jgi:Family of unknown function (DUF6339)
MSALLKGLNLAARTLVADRAFRTGEVSAFDAGPYLVEDLGLGRAIPVAPLQAVVDRAMRMHRAERRESDAWLAPRVHATIRLTRREAADRRLWAYLATVTLPNYPRWRWADPRDARAPIPIDRFVGDDATNALSWLWWTAELTRNGADYGPTVKALSGPWFTPSWLKLNAMHHRAAALAVVDFLGAAEDEATAGDHGRAMIRALDIALRTLSLDSLAPDAAPDAEAVREWCSGRVDETLILERLPTGPDEPPVPEADVAVVRAVLDRLAEQAGLKAARTRRRAGAKAS